LQEENQSTRAFSERTDRLAAKLGISLRALGPKVGISPAMLFAYRSGNQSVSRKAWGKIRAAEVEAGLAAPLPATIDEQPPIQGSPSEMERYLAFVHGCRHQAELLAAGDQKRAVEIFDRLLATWMSGNTKPHTLRKRAVTTNYDAVLEQVLKEQQEKPPLVAEDQSSAETQEGPGR
jgi:hypothetical protein